MARAVYYAHSAAIMAVKAWEVAPKVKAASNYVLYNYSPSFKSRTDTLSKLAPTEKGQRNLNKR